MVFISFSINIFQSNLIINIPQTVAYNNPFLNPIHNQEGEPKKLDYLLSLLQK
jgi:hypothetical protein